MDQLTPTTTHQVTTIDPAPRFDWHTPQHPRLPFRDRSVLPGTVHRFTPLHDPRDDFELVITTEVADELQQLARAAHPNETFGLLLGRSFYDCSGTYTLATATVAPPELTATPGGFHVDHTQSAALTHTALNRHPTLDIVGWWHSHHTPSSFSNLDRQQQRLWDEPHHVGLLVFTRHKPTEPWATAYHGPDAQPLTLTGPATATNPPPHTQPLPALTNPSIHPDPRDAAHPHAPSPPISPWWWIAIIASTTLAATITATTIATALLTNTN
jgi:proteasome lid subunit RPN8/RPN11